MERLIWRSGRFRRERKVPFGCYKSEEGLHPWIQEDETVLNDGLNPRERSALQGQTGGYQCSGAGGAEDSGRWACPGRRPERRRRKPEREPIVSPDFKVGRGRGLWRKTKKGQGDMEKPGKTHLGEDQAEVFRRDGSSSRAQ